MIVEYLKNGDPIKIAKLQDTYDLELSPDYVEFLKKTNGVISKDGKTFRVNGLDEEIELDSLYGFTLDRDWLDIDFWMNQYASELPANTVIIGTDVLDNFIILICSGEDAGVYYWDSSFSFEASNEASNAYLVANSFSEFSNMMEGFSEEES